jgi:MvdD family ATP-grasp ribosomal peptide maturase
MMTVLIVSKTDDNECVDLVTQAIEQRGGRVFRFDTDLFPTETRMVMQSVRGMDRLTLTSPSEEIDLDDVTAVWYRRSHFGGAIPESMDRQLRAASVGECRATILGLIASLPAFQMDPIAIFRHASHKQLQLQVARDLGLITPRTLTTNDPDAVRAFARQCEAGVVTKMLSSFAIFDEQGNDSVVFTTSLKSEDLEDLDGLEYCPMTFQERVPKKLELRATVVGDRVFSASIDPSILARSEHDWRREGEELIEHWQPYDLPAEASERLLGMMDFFDLNYGAFDLIVTPDGHYVFLEVNPIGEYFWLDRHPDLSISPAIADVLLGRAPRRTRNPIRRVSPNA